MGSAARRWNSRAARPTVSLSVSANVPVEPAETPERLAAAERDGGSEAPSALDETERSDTGKILQQALATLSERQRLIVTMFDVDGLTSTEIGAMLELAPGTVRWHLHEARQHLRRVLAHFFGG